MNNARKIPTRKRGVAAHAAGFLACLALTAIGFIASILWGSNNLSFSEVIAALTLSEDTTPLATSIVWDQRLPRTLVLIAVGAALGVAGAIIQALTRNPLADPGILGINAGAALFVVFGFAYLGVRGLWPIVILAIVGAAVAAAVVTILGGVRHPARLTLAGVAISMAISSIVEAVVLSNQDAFNEFRFWTAGSAEGTTWALVQVTAATVAVGLFVSVILSGKLNILALGDDLGTSLGLNVWQVRAGGILAVTVLAGVGTAAVGPIMFVGLAVPYAARAFVGYDQRAIIPACMLIGPVFLIGADIIARLVMAPRELPAGLLVTFIGGPIFIAVVRARRLGAI